MLCERMHVYMCMPLKLYHVSMHVCTCALSVVQMDICENSCMWMFIFISCPSTFTRRLLTHVHMHTHISLSPVGKHHIWGAGEAENDGEGLGGSGSPDLGFLPKWSPSQDDPGRINNIVWLYKYVSSTTYEIRIRKVSFSNCVYVRSSFNIWQRINEQCARIHVRSLL